MDQSSIVARQSDTQDEGARGDKEQEARQTILNILHVTSRYTAWQEAVTSQGSVNIALGAAVSLGVDQPPGREIEVEARL